MTDTLDLFAALDRRDEAIARADAALTDSKGGDELVGRVTKRLMLMHRAGETFSVDDLGVILDEMQVPKDAATRRRIVGTIINRGKDKLWQHAGYISSRDPRRNARPVALWRRLSIHNPLAGVPQPARLGRAEV